VQLKNQEIDEKLNKKRKYLKELLVII